MIDGSDNFFLKVTSLCCCCGNANNLKLWKGRIAKEFRDFATCDLDLHSNPAQICWNCEQILLPIVKRFCWSVKKTICLLNMRPSKKCFKDFAEMRSVDEETGTGTQKGSFICVIQPQLAITQEPSKNPDFCKWQILIKLQAKFGILWPKLTKHFSIGFFCLVVCYLSSPCLWLCPLSSNKLLSCLTRRLASELKKVI